MWFLRCPCTHITPATCAAVYGIECDRGLTEGLLFPLRITSPATWCEGIFLLIQVA